jgi:hypothetical protein
MTTFGLNSKYVVIFVSRSKSASLSFLVRPKKSVLKSASEKELLFVRLEVRKVTFFIK